MLRPMGYQTQAHEPLCSASTFCAICPLLAASACMQWLGGARMYVLRWYRLCSVTGCAVVQTAEAKAQWAMQEP